jgi:hypothetical protein
VLNRNKAYKFISSLISFYVRGENILEEEDNLLDAELSEIDRELPALDETIKELYETPHLKSEPKAPYGYYLKKKKLKIKDEEARNIKLIFSWFYTQKRSIEEIAEKVHLAVSRIKDILINPIYFGKIFLNGEIREGKHPAIIDKHFCKIYNIEIEEITQAFLSSIKR